MNSLVDFLPPFFHSLTQASLLEEVGLLLSHHSVIIQYTIIKYSLTVSPVALAFLLLFHSVMEASLLQGVGLIHHSVEIPNL